MSLANPFISFFLFCSQPLNIYWELASLTSTHDLFQAQSLTLVSFTIHPQTNANTFGCSQLLFSPLNFYFLPPSFCGSLPSSLPHLPPLERLLIYSIRWEFVSNESIDALLGRLPARVCILLFSSTFIVDIFVDWSVNSTTLTATNRPWAMVWFLLISVNGASVENERFSTPTIRGLDRRLY